MKTSLCMLNVCHYKKAINDQVTNPCILLVLPLFILTGRPKTVKHFKINTFAKRKLFNFTNVSIFVSLTSIISYYFYPQTLQHLKKGGNKSIINCKGGSDVQAVVILHQLCPQNISWIQRKICMRYTIKQKTRRKRA